MRRRRKPRCADQTRHRRLLFEHFEDRRLLATANDDSFVMDANTALDGRAWDNDYYNDGQWEQCLTWEWIDEEYVCTEWGTAWASGAIGSGPSNGTLTTADDGGRYFTYVPYVNFVGSDSFTYSVHDDQSTSWASVSIDVTSMGGQAPDVNDDWYTVRKDTPLVVNTAQGLLSNDEDDGGVLTNLHLTTVPAAGAITDMQDDGSFTYVPNENFYGWDSFTYLVTDGFLGNFGIVWINVNVPPVAQNDSYLVAQNASLSVPATGVLANDTDLDANSLTAEVVATPEHGTLVLVPSGGFSYTPAAGYTGPDSFTYRAYDGYFQSEVATVELTVVPVDNSLIAHDKTYPTTAGQAVWVTDPAFGVLQNAVGPQGTALTAQLDSQPEYSTLTFHDDGTFTSEPNSGFFTTDSFKFRVRAGQALSPLATVTIQNALATDIALTKFYADGVNLQVQYAILDSVSGPVGPFTIGIYASPDGATPQQLLQEFAVPPSYRTQGLHTLALTPTFPDLPGDYYLLAKIDNHNDIDDEANENNNKARLLPGSFVVNELVTGETILHVHGDNQNNAIWVANDCPSWDPCWYVYSPQAAIFTSSAGTAYDFTGDGVVTIMDSWAAGNYHSATTNNWLPFSGWDVYADGILAPNDALELINLFNSRGEHLLTGYPQSGEFRVDVSNDLVFSVHDINLMIDRLNNPTVPYTPPPFQPGGPTVASTVATSISWFLEQGRTWYWDTDFDQVHIRAHGGDDTAGVGTIPAWFIGGDGNDFFSGGNLGDLIDGGSGDDHLQGRGGDDQIFGGADIDWLYGDSPVENAFVTPGKDLLYGGDDNDVLFGNGLSDQLFGGDGNDNLDGGTGDDFLFGDNAVSLAPTVPGPEGEPEGEPGTGNDDVLTGGDGNDALYGDQGNDTLDGGDGDDNLNGGTGADTLYGYGGNDTINPGGDTGDYSPDPECCENLDLLSYPIQMAPCDILSSSPGDVLAQFGESVLEGNAYKRLLGFHITNPSGGGGVPYPLDLHVRVELIDVSAANGADYEGASTFEVRVPGGFMSPDEPHIVPLSIPTLIDDSLEPNETFKVRTSVVEYPICGSYTVPVTIRDTTVVALDDNAFVLLNTPKSLSNLTDNDKVTPSGTYTLSNPPFSAIESFTQPEHGAVAWNSPFLPTHLVYTPHENYIGDDSFTYTVHWGISTAPSISTATVRLSVGPTVNVDDAPAVIESVEEGDPPVARFRVWLPEPLDHSAYVDFQTLDLTPPDSGTPQERARRRTFYDFTDTVEQLVFAAGQTEQYVDVPILDDDVDEFSELLGVKLLKPFGVSSGQMAATGQILDDDNAPSLSIAAATVNEPAESDAFATLTVSLSRQTEKEASVDFAALQIPPNADFASATADQDFDDIESSATLPVNALSFSISVPLLADSAVEPLEKFDVVLQSADNATITADRAQVSILDTDSAAALTTDVTPSASEGTQYVSADLPTAVYVATVIINHQATDPAQRYAADGSEVTWYITKDGQTTEVATTTTGGFTILSRPVSTLAGSKYTVEARVTRLMQSGSLVAVTASKITAASAEVVAGESARIETTVTRPRLIADSRSLTMITAQVYDAADNRVQDGTSIHWELSGAASLVHGMPSTQNGQATAIIRAGHLHETNPLTIRAGDVQIQPSLTTLPILIDMAANLQFVEANSGQLVHVTAIIHDEDGNSVPDGTPIHWLTQKGKLVSPTTTIVQNGAASATISVADTGVGPSFVITRVLEYVGQTSFEISAPPHSSAKMTITFDKSWIAGDRQTSGSWTFTLPDDTTEQIPYWHETTGYVLGGHPYSLAYVYVSNPELVNLVTISGSAGANAVYLDAEGRGQFTIRSQGVLTASQFAIIPIEAEINGPGGTPFLSEPGDWRGATKFVAAPYETGAIGRFFWGAASGEAEGAAGASGDIVLSVIPIAGLYSDMRDVAKGVADWAQFGWNDDRVDKVSLGISAAGILLEITPADWLADALKQINKVIRWLPAKSRNRK